MTGNLLKNAIKSMGLPRNRTTKKTREVAQKNKTTEAKPRKKLKISMPPNKFKRKSREGHVRTFQPVKNLKITNFQLNNRLERKSASMQLRRLQTARESITSKKTLRSTAKHVKDNKTERVPCVVA